MNPPTNDIEAALDALVNGNGDFKRNDPFIWQAIYHYRNHLTAPEKCGESLPNITDIRIRRLVEYAEGSDIADDPLIIDLVRELRLLQKSLTPAPELPEQGGGSKPLLRRYTDDQGNEMIAVAAWFYDQMVDCMEEEGQPVQSADVEGPLVCNSPYARQVLQDMIEQVQEEHANNKCTIEGCSFLAQIADLAIIYAHLPTISLDWMGGDLQNEVCGIVTKYGVEPIYDATDEILLAVERAARSRQSGHLAPSHTCDYKHVDTHGVQTCDCGALKPAHGAGGGGRYNRAVRKSMHRTSLRKNRMASQIASWRYFRN